MESLSNLVVNVQGALYGGIRSDVPGHGGEECTNYLDRKLMLLDTGIGVYEAMSIAVLIHVIV